MSGIIEHRNRFVQAMLNNSDFVLHLASVRLDLIILRLNMPHIYSSYLHHLEICLDHIFELIPDRNNEE